MLGWIKIIQLAKATPDGIKTEQPEIHSIHTFSNQKEKKRIAIELDNLSFHNNQYKDFKDFKSDVEKVYTNFRDIYKPLEIKRIGLRFINEITIKHGNPFEWNDYINHQLTNQIDNFFEKEYLSRIMTTVTLNKGDYCINFIFGIHNPEFPSKISRKEFIIDIDCYTQEYKDTVFEFLDLADNECELFFEKSIDEELRNIMKGANNETKISWWKRKVLTRIIP